MKKFTHYLTLLSIALLPFMMACNNDDDEEEDAAAPVATNQGFPKGVAAYNYSVQIVPGNATIDGKVSGVEGATVIISQGGESETSLTVQGGIAHFEGLNPGTVNGTVIADGYVNVNFSAEVLPEQLSSDSNQVRNVASTITVFENNAELRARIYGDYNLLNVAPNLQDPSNFQQTTVFVVYHLLDYPMGSGSGRLTDVNLEVSTVNYRSPSTGIVRLTDIAGTVEGVLEAELFMQDVAVLDNNTNGDILFNIHPIRNQPGTPLNLLPGSVLNLGDIQAKKRIP
jgi:hypothetical protein